MPGFLCASGEVMRSMITAEEKRFQLAKERLAKLKLKQEILGELLIEAQSQEAYILMKYPQLKSQNQSS